ncbi:MAG TPA: hypothetical protein VNK24_10675 [Elusimicrobiota bacterium]|nr:hypothetical protein [Elusimicrobiota bacterium]
MTRKALGKIAAAFFCGCLFLLTIHDLAHAKEKHPAQDHCPACALIARTAAHKAKAAPHVVSHATLISVAPLPAVKPVCRALPRAASRDPPTA